MCYAGRSEEFFEDAASRYNGALLAFGPPGAGTSHMLFSKSKSDSGFVYRLMEDLVASVEDSRREDAARQIDVFVSRPKA